MTALVLSPYSVRALKNQIAIIRSELNALESELADHTGLDLPEGITDAWDALATMDEILGGPDVRF